MGEGGQVAQGDVNRYQWAKPQQSRSIRSGQPNQDAAWLLLCAGCPSRCCHVALNRPQVNTGLPAFKIGLESVGGSVAGGVVVYAIVYAGKMLPPLC